QRTTAMSARFSRRQKATPKRLGSAAFLMVAAAFLLLGALGYAVPPPLPASAMPQGEEGEIEMAGNGKGEWRLLGTKARRVNMDEKICDCIYGSRNYFLAAGIFVAAVFLLLRWQAQNKRSGAGGQPSDSEAAARSGDR
ncbi:MAG: hypothetical protein N3A66_06200, partial [Planctomycetota bacterium]|nr:hypothetical protein [Planctomycetota bacterium]